MEYSLDPIPNDVVVATAARFVSPAPADADARVRGVDDMIVCNGRGINIASENRCTTRVLHSHVRNLAILHVEVHVPLRCVCDVPRGHSPKRYSSCAHILERTSSPRDVLRTFEYR